MYYSGIKTCDIANGFGVRTVLFVSGCRNHCEGCFQPETWNFTHGKLFTKKTEDEIIKATKPYYIAGLTLLGGEPFEEENQKRLTPFLRRFKQECPEKNIWAFTGYLLDDLLKHGRKHTKDTVELLSYINVLVDGPFALAKKNIAVNFRGSENQRIINMDEYRRTGEIVTILEN